MAIVRFAPTLKDQVLAPILTAFDAGAGPATIGIYSGTIPADTTTAITSQVLLGTLTFSDPCGSIASGALTMAPVSSDLAADATGTAAWARIKDSAGVVIMDLNVTSTGGGGALTLNTTNIVIGGPILITSFIISVA